MVKRARTAKPSEVELRAFLYEIARYIGENSQIIKTDLKKVRPGQMFSFFPQISDSGEQERRWCSDRLDDGQPKLASSSPTSLQIPPNRSHS